MSDLDYPKVKVSLRDKNLTPGNHAHLGDQLNEMLMKAEHSLLCDTIGNRSKILDFFMVIDSSIRNQKGVLGAFQFFGDRETIAQFLWSLDNSLKDVNGSNVVNLKGSAIAFPQSVTEITGLRSGQEGYSPDGGAFIQKVSRLIEGCQESRMNAIVIHDVEDAHYTIQDIFAMMIKNGYIESTGGRRVYLRNTIVIFTSSTSIGGAQTVAQAKSQLVEMTHGDGRPVFSSSLVTSLKPMLFREPSPPEVISHISFKIGNATTRKAGTLEWWKAGICRANPSLIEIFWPENEVILNSLYKITGTCVGKMMENKNLHTYTNYISEKLAKNPSEALTIGTTFHRDDQDYVEVNFPCAYLEKNGYPVKRIGYWKDLDSKNFAKNLKSFVFGQDEIIDDLADRVFVRLYDLSDMRPLSSVLVIGASDSGKTFLGETIASVAGVPLLKCDCNEMQTEEKIQEVFFGKQPNSVVSCAANTPGFVLLLDEIDKANPRIWEMIMTLNEKGTLKDLKTGEVLSLKNAFIYMTSNYMVDIAETLSSMKGEYDIQQIDDSLRNTLFTTGTLAEHHISRVDRVYNIRPLEGEETLQMWGSFIRSMLQSQNYVVDDAEVQAMAKFMEIRWQERSVIGGGRARRRAFEDLSIKCRTGRSDCLVVDPQSGKIILNRKYSSDFVKVPERQRLWEVTQERADAFRDVYRGDTWQGEMFLTEIKRAAKKVNPTEPVSVILATGPKGTGKTFLGEAAAVAFGKGVPVKIECQQSVESHMVAPFLFGSPPGYKNSEMGGALTRPLLARKDQIIIFDEFTRAHSSLIETIMNVLGAGTAVDMGTRRVVDLKQCLFILTTNEKGDELAEMVEKMEASGSLPDEIEEAARELLAPTLKPEHWDRIRLVLPITKTPSNRVIVDAVIKEYDLGGKVTEDQIERALEKGKSLKKNVGWRQRKKFFEGELVD